jgi:NhaP-type Na+/H+ or K+/H+ antiporter
MAAGADMLVRSQQLRGVWGALVYLGLVAVGGLVLGVVMGAALVQIVRPSGSRTAEPTAS